MQTREAGQQSGKREVLGTWVGHALICGCSSSIALDLNAICILTASVVEHKLVLQEWALESCLPCLIYKMGLNFTSAGCLRGLSESSPMKRC